MVTLEYGSKNKIGGLLCYSGSFINNKQPLTKDHKIPPVATPSKAEKTQVHAFINLPFAP